MTGYGHAFAIAAVSAALLGAVAAQTPTAPPAAAEPWGAGVDASIMRRVARVQAAEPGDGRVAQASGFVIDRYNRLVLTSCRIVFSEREALAIEVEFAEAPSVKRAADALLCNRSLDLAVVRVRAFDIEFPRPVNPSPTRRIRPGDALYVLGFASGSATALPVVVDVTDTELPGLSGHFVGTRSGLSPGAAEGALQNLTDLDGGPLVTPQGDLVGVNAFSSGERIRQAASGVEVTTVPKGGYFARTVDTIAPLIRQVLAIRP
jgi:S1-C subfamily serine protease